ncbi:hypothetical protein N7457_002289 [Penicillium paradoxum]|uniref:uncharacterized protein n=1 Tax=Penicillium paradoxum TaxID=176176 RepID=UPI00254899B4|nr:uncharacterized protein N7457_002289 [Penicillium paradoxum]KAJ5787299.1 hypothetical protein N7457_002289 [Penicillium paradoxum]
MASHLEEYPGDGIALRLQPGSGTKPAVNRVLDTPEILEMILVRMDMRSLLTSAQRVCHSWTKLITKSPSIQKCLYFTPIKDSEWGMEESFPNPLLTETFPSIFPAKDRLDHYTSNFSDLTMTEDATTMARFVRKDASWRKMLVQQPPISELGTFQISHGMRGYCAGSSGIPELRCGIQADQEMQQPGQEGLRMERLFELLLFSPRVGFTAYTKARVYWHSEEPIRFNESRPNINDEFHRTLSSAAELVRQQVITAYGEEGLNVRSKRLDIEKLGREEVTKKEKEEAMIR